MEINVGEKEREAVDGAMLFYVLKHQKGNRQRARMVATCVQKTLHSKGYSPPYEYVLNRWYELTEQNREEKPASGRKNPAQQAAERNKDHWKRVGIKVYIYLSRLPPPPPMDIDAAAKVLGGPEFIAGAFKYNGRAIENRLNKEGRGKVKKLESAGLVRGRRLEIEIQKERKDGRSERGEFAVYYWEPFNGKPEEKTNGSENKCHLSEEELNRLDTELAEGAEVYLRDDIWNGAKNGKKVRI